MIVDAVGATSPFFDAVNSGDSEAAGLMLAADPDLATARDATGATALHHAAFNANWQLVDVLLSAGADLNARDTIHDATPAGWAIHRMRERGALLAIEIDDVLFAISRGDSVWAQRLITRHPALIQAVDRDGKPLSVSAAGGPSVEIAAMFTASGGLAHTSREAP